MSEYEEDFGDVGPYTNRDDKMERILPALSCSHCPPNRNENSNRGARKRMYQSGPREKAETRDRNKARAHKAERNSVQ